MKKLPLHWQILLGMVLGIAVGLIASNIGGEKAVRDWISPFGAIFINLLKLIALPLILASLIKGVSDLRDMSTLSQMGGRTILLYLFTTVVAITLGLLLVNIVDPGHLLSPETRESLMTTYGVDAEKSIQAAAEQQGKGPLQPLVDLVPDNIFAAATNNRNMLQVIFFAILFGIGIVLIPDEKSRTIKAFFDGFNEVILKIIDLIMLAAPYGVFALLAGLIVDFPSIDMLYALLGYGLTVVVGLGILLLLFYPTLVRVITGRSFSFFFKGISPAQLLAFSTSSSAATLPVTMERVEEHLGVDEEVASFVLPIGATINMDGTSLYQAVAAVFIAQALNIDLTIGQQLGIVLTALLASIGAAAVPGAGMVMLVIVLAQAGIPEAGLALIFAIDRPLDMLRTVTNITSDASVSMIVAKSLGKLNDPKEKKWDDNYPPIDDTNEDA
ncbi:MAG: dicarboxylate/amino acid:cation symporter [Saprospirales bacterium]|nr:dicarboxylate/amino acid:cation symporter [Saprospirales bacterium]